MALFCATIRRYSASLLKFLFFRYFIVLSYISWVCILKYPYSCFSSHSWFLVIVVLFIFMLSELLLAAVISLFFLSFFMKSSIPRIDASTLSKMLTSPFRLSFFDTYGLCTSSLEYNTLCIVINFLVRRSNCLSSSLVHFKNGPGYLKKMALPKCLPLWWNFCCRVWFLEALSFVCCTLFLFFLSSLLVWQCLLPIF